MFTTPDSTRLDNRTPASSAGRARGGIRRRSRHGAPLNARLATVAKPCSSVRSASSRCAMRSPEGRPGSGTWTHQQNTRRPPGGTSTAPASPTSQTPSAPRSGTSPVCACSSRASWPTRSPSRPSATRSGAVLGPRLRPHDVGPAPRVELRDRPRVREQREPDRERQRLEREQQAGGARRTGPCARRWSASTCARASAGGARPPAAASGRRRSPAAARRPPCPAASRPRSGGGGSRGRRRAAAPRPAAPGPRPR